MKKLVFALFVAAFVTLSTSVGYTANWQWIASNEKVGIFFDPSSIKFERAGESINENIIYVWWYMQFDDAYAQQRPFHGKAVKKLVQYSKINSDSQMITSIDAAMYDKDGDTIYRGSVGDKASRIIPGTYEDALANAVIDYTYKHREEILERSR